MGRDSADAVRDPLVIRRKKDSQQRSQSQIPRRELRMMSLEEVLQLAAGQPSLASKLRLQYLKMALSTPVMRAELLASFGLQSAGEKETIDPEDCQRLIRKLERLDQSVDTDDGGK